MPTPQKGFKQRDPEVSEVVGFLPQVAAPGPVGRGQAFPPVKVASPQGQCPEGSSCLAVAPGGVPSGLPAS